jgi:putative transport protein
MLDQIVNVLRSAPEAALFLSIGAGFALGRLALGPIRLGGICGTLLVALLLGQLEVSVPTVVKDFAFACFLFALGFGAGPRLFAQLDAGAWRVAVLSLNECVCAVLIVLFATWLLELDPGTSAGLLAGGATESAVLGTASDALARLPRSAVELARLQSNLATTYSISYLCGLLAIVLFCSQLAPRMLRIDLAREAAKLWRALGGTASARRSFGLLPQLVTRSFVVARSDAPTVAELEHDSERRMMVETVERAGKVLDVTGRLRLRAQDQLLVSGERSALIRMTDSLGRELPSSPAVSASLAQKEVLITHAKVDSLGALTHCDLLAGQEALQIDAITRAGRELPLLPTTSLARGDVVHVLGDADELERFTRHVGVTLTPHGVTSLLMLSSGVLVGYALGSPSLSWRGVELSLGPGGGCLLAGLIAGWAHTRWLRLGDIPRIANELLKELGLSVFIAAVGLSAGARALDVLRQYGWTLPLASLLVTLVPATVSLLLGRHVLKVEAPILLGAIAGQQCSTPAINAVVSAAGNSSPMLGYTVTYALSNILLPLLGPLVVSLTSR